MTGRLITVGGSFTVNLWDAEDRRVGVKFSKPATYEEGEEGSSPNDTRMKYGGVERH